MTAYERWIARFDELARELMRARGYASTDEITQADIQAIYKQMESDK